MAQSKLGDWPQRRSYLASPCNGDICASMTPGHLYRISTAPPGNNHTAGWGGLLQRHGRLASEGVDSRKVLISH